ncbi:beta-carotene ketolase CrtW [Aerosakkonema funiforme]|uniref:beta-carotene ketolase CrtW n=1 Tax=Aerosakkonema funiforme TaxID=1246630 RepID=UPI0035B7B697
MFQSQRISFNWTSFHSLNLSKESLYSIIIAFIIMLVWAISLTFLLHFNLSQVNFLWILLGVVWQTFIYTGLFITAHDAMHGVVFPINPKINNFIGSLCLLAYALFNYKQLVKKHSLHHHNPASELDPDFHDEPSDHLFVWYFKFMRSYCNWKQLIGLMSLFYSIDYVFHISAINLILFWVIPPLLSSLQLFYFGTFLPHREPEGGYTNCHRAQTNPLPVFWSFIACYHFGYHEEHHEYPHLPWWKLPEAYSTKK